MVREREEAITQIVKSISELAQIFKELSDIIVDQVCSVQCTVQCICVCPVYYVMYLCVVVVWCVVCILFYFVYIIYMYDINPWSYLNDRQ